MSDPKLLGNVKRLVEAIAEAGLVPLVADNHAYETLNRIIDTGSSMPDGSEEDEDMTNECLRVFGKPELWGWMTDRTRQTEWTDFCVDWYESLFNRGKTR